LKRVLTIAGSDSGGGAGIQADLKTITVLGAYGMSAVTALTAQNTLGVVSIHRLPPRFVFEQIEAVAQDVGVDAAKTGMLADPEIVETVAEAVERFALRPLVSDPVMYSKSGHELLTAAARTAYVEKVLPLADLVTPNLAEASLLCGFEVETETDRARAARIIHDMGARAVLIKGGHGKGEFAEDLLFDGTSYRTFSAPRLPSRNTHGIGCTYSAAIATFLAQGLAIFDAVTRAKAFVTDALRFSHPIGKGHGPTNPYGAAFRDAQRYQVLTALQKAADILRREPGLVHLAPEVQSNLGYALPHAATVEEVAAFPGRLARLSEGLAPVAFPAFGASRHIAGIILAAMRFDPELRSAMNLRYSETILSRAQRKGLAIAEFNRGLEPPHIKAQEGATLQWGITEALRACPQRPDLIFDTGDVGKEPMIRVVGTDPQDVLEKVFLLMQD